MPPAFNLSQDQTLQFNLCLKTHSLNGIDQIFTTSEFLLYLSVSIWPKRPGLFRPRLSHPNTHAYRLLIFKERFWLTCHQHRSEIITRFCLSCQALAQIFCLPEPHRRSNQAAWAHASRNLPATLP